MVPGTERSRNIKLYVIVSTTRMFSKKNKNEISNEIPRNEVSKNEISKNDIYINE
jgi:hypothetical protein